MDEAPTTLLVVEDDDSIAVPLVEGLEYAGFRVLRAATGREALAAGPVDLVLLDLGLPDLDGGEVCRRLREMSSAPIIVVSARGDELDRVLLLELGADDYVVKPFGFRELVARIRAVLRRTSGESLSGKVNGANPPARKLADDVLGALRIDPRTRTVSLAGRALTLTTKEFDLLAMLAEDPGAVRRREEIIARVWDENFFGPTKTLDVHVATLRRKLGDPAWITTLRGVGYRLSAPS
jgi:two-component system response regulator RegX3